jgi:hypothetical protein
LHAACNRDQRLDERLKARGAEFTMPPTDVTGSKIAMLNVPQQARNIEESFSMTKKHDSQSGDWRVEMLSRLRTLIEEAEPDMTEERKWRKPSNQMVGIPVWSHNGIVCTGEAYKNSVKITFAKGAFVKDPSGLFNSSLEGNLRRAIDFHEGDKIKEQALKALITAAVKLNAPGRN